MNNSIFRKKAIDRISSSEEMNQYMKVTNPPVWMALAAIIIILLGAIGFGIFGKIESKVTGVTIVNEGVATCYVSEKNITNITEDSIIRINNNEVAITNINSTPVSSATLSTYACSIASFNQGEYVYAITLDATLNDGNYETSIVIESISPFSFIWN